MRATLKRRLETLERRSNIAEIALVPIVDTTKWPEGDRFAFLAAETDDADAILERYEGFRQPMGRPNEITLIVISRQPDTPEERAESDTHDAALAIPTGAKISVESETLSAVEDCLSPPAAPPWF